MFALKHSSVIRYENIEFAGLCFNEDADYVEESGCWFFMCNSCADSSSVAIHELQGLLPACYDHFTSELLLCQQQL